MELGIVVVLALLVGLRDAECERGQCILVASDLPEALGQHRKELRRLDPDPDLSQPAQRLLHLCVHRVSSRTR